MKDRSAKQHRSAEEQCDLDALLRQAIRSTARSVSERTLHQTGDDIDSRRRGSWGRLWTRIQWSWEFGAPRRWWLGLWPIREHVEAPPRPRWAVAQALTALVLPGAVLYLFLLSQLDIAQIVIAMRLGLSVMGKGW